MSSTFVAIAASIAAVSISIVIGIKIYRRYSNRRKQQPPPCKVEILAVYHSLDNFNSIILHFSIREIPTIQTAIHGY